MLTTIYQFARHHIPEAMYLHGIFTTVLGQPATIKYILFACRHTLTNEEFGNKITQQVQYSHKQEISMVFLH